MKSYKFLLPGLVFAVLAIFLYRGLSRDPSVVPSPLIGKPAPAFTLSSVTDPNKQVSTADYAGRPYLVNIWATWCAECRHEHDTLLAIASTKRIPIVGIDWKDDRKLAQRWLDQLGNPYDAVAFDPEGRVAIDWGVYGAPETFLVGANGAILHKHIGALTPQIWQRDFLSRIDTPKAATP